MPYTTPRVFNRDREVARHRRLLERLHSPRLQMSFIAAMTAAGGLLASYLLRMLGMSSMALRYPVAVGIAYLVFLFLLWCWLRRGDGDDAAAEDTVDAADLGVEVAASGRTEAASSASDAVADGGGLGIDADEGVFIGLVVAGAVALGAVLLASFSIISMAPVLFAELVVDAALAGGLYNHVRSIDRERHWFTTALARTGWRFAALAGVASAVGWLITRLVPGADSLGALLH
ncbi:MAG: hypothetical protein JNN30_01405 [Rhodanobacteraceae bacterium]|nr:hypothetical protein [Rhodanobacteraceae bacterium]